MVFGKQVGYLERLEHIARIAVASKSHSDPAFNHFEHGRATNSVAHIGFRVVDHVGLAAMKQANLAIVNMNAMSGDGLPA